MPGDLIIAIKEMKIPFIHKATICIVVRRNIEFLRGFSKYKTTVITPQYFFHCYDANITFGHSYPVYGTKIKKKAPKFVPELLVCDQA
jgi:hypothetical protein